MSTSYVSIRLGIRLCTFIERVSGMFEPHVGYHYYINLFLEAVKNDLWRRGGCFARLG
jgi:hypothetical protein